MFRILIFFGLSFCMHSWIEINFCDVYMQNIHIVFFKYFDVHILIFSVFKHIFDASQCEIPKKFNFIYFINLSEFIGQYNYRLESSGKFFLKKNINNLSKIQKVKLTKPQDE